ncbi:MAG: hypothetical protein LUH82_07205 [Clostridiales bacterium]|nr:hypothetical protein [Clostridiales bacterium]
MGLILGIGLIDDLLDRRATRRRKAETRCRHRAKAAADMAEWDALCAQVKERTG